MGENKGQPFFLRVNPPKDPAHLAPAAVSKLAAKRRSDPLARKIEKIFYKK
jgi:hypothetical protein